MLRAVVPGGHDKHPANDSTAEQCPETLADLEAIWEGAPAPAEVVPVRAAA